MAEMSLEAKIQRVMDIQEVQNVASLHEYYHSAMMHKEELEAIWAQKTPGVSWTNNTDKYKGMASLKKFYADHLVIDKQRSLEALNKIDPGIKVKPENYGAGILWVHMLTTPVIRLAGDGKTAKGIWMSFGHITGPMGGKMSAMWAYEKYGMDFVKEDGEWKIWHLHTFVDFYSPVDGIWTDPTRNIASGAGTRVEEEPGGADFPTPDEKGVFYKGYNLSTVPVMEPKPPVPYYTFSETFSY
jgi:hypothetical protein